MPEIRYRVRLKQVGGSRTRTCTVVCGSEAEAGELALAEVGEDWKILELEAS